MTTAPFDDSTIAPAELVYRRIHSVGDVSMMISDEATGELRPRGGAFKIHEDGCSAYLDSELVAQGLGPEDVRTKPTGQAVISVTAADVRGVGFGLQRDPWPPDSDGHKRDAAHALIVNHQGIGKNPRARALSHLAALAKICVI